MTLKKKKDKKYVEFAWCVECEFLYLTSYHLAELHYRFLSAGTRSVCVFARFFIHLWCSGNNRLSWKYFIEQQDTPQYILQKFMLVSVLFLGKETQMIM